MRINDQTKIAALLKAHPGALEAIVTLSPDFSKLRNPLLRRLMAGRTSIAMAARIGGIRPADFFRTLAPLGFEADGATPEQEMEKPGDQPSPGWLKECPADRIVTLDVRPILEGGLDPLKRIQAAVGGLLPAQVLRIVNTFEPTPLIRLLGAQGFSSYVDKQGEKHVETYFYKAAASAEAPPQEAGDDWNNLLAGFGSNLDEIDVRHLAMPAPMTTILEALEHLPAGKALFVHHKRVPVFLLPELKDRGFAFRIRDAAEAEVKLLIFRAK